MKDNWNELHGYLSEQLSCTQDEISAVYRRLKPTHGALDANTPLRDSDALMQQEVQREVRLLRSEMTKNFGLTRFAFEEMLEALKRDDESLFEQIFLAHFDDCMAFLKRQYGANHTDAYDASMEGLLEFRKRLVAGKIAYGNLRFLLTRMAAQVYVKWKRKKVPVTSLDAALHISDADRNAGRKELNDVLNKAWDRLGIECQVLLKRYYYERMTFAEIGRLLGRSDMAMRKQKQRCVLRLRQLFKQFM